MIKLSCDLKLQNVILSKNLFFNPYLKVISFLPFNRRKIYTNVMFKRNNKTSFETLLNEVPQTKLLFLNNITVIPFNYNE